LLEPPLIGFRKVASYFGYDTNSRIQTACADCSISNGATENNDGSLSAGKMYRIYAEMPYWNDVEHGGLPLVKIIMRLST
jgi:hypothetical protein